MPFQRPAAAFLLGSISGWWEEQPCCGESVSGDGLFLEVNRADGLHLLLLVDVSGHGPGAADVVTDLEQRYLLRPQCQNRQPAELLQTLHELLQQDWAASGRFVAALVLLLDGNGGNLIGGNAAQPSPQRGQPGGAWQPWDLDGGPPLGIPVPDLVYGQTGGTFSSGEQLLAFTDGVTEAGRTGGLLFMHGLLQQFLGSLTSGLGGDAMLALLRGALQAHVGGGWPEDDTTAFCLQWS